MIDDARRMKWGGLFVCIMHDLDGDKDRLQLIDLCFYVLKSDGSYSTAAPFPIDKKGFWHGMQKI